MNSESLSTLLTCTLLSTSPPPRSHCQCLKGLSYVKAAIYMTSDFLGIRQGPETSCSRAWSLFDCSQCYVRPRRIGATLAASLTALKGGMSSSTSDMSPVWSQAGL